MGKSSLSAESTDLGIIIDTDKITAENGGDRIKGGKVPDWITELIEYLNK